MHNAYAPPAGRTQTINSYKNTLLQAEQLQVLHPAQRSYTVSLSASGTDDDRGWSLDCSNATVCTTQGGHSGRRTVNDLRQQLGQTRDGLVRTYHHLTAAQLPQKYSGNLEQLVQRVDDRDIDRQAHQPRRQPNLHTTVTSSIGKDNGLRPQHRSFPPLLPQCSTFNPH